MNSTTTEQTLDDRKFTENDLASWIFALNIISGVGILTNSILAFMIIVDFVIDKSVRLWTRHWLLLNSSITHVAYLGIAIYMREFGVKLEQTDRKCLVLQHTDKTVEFVTILYLIVIAINIIGNVVKPGTPCGKRNILFWIIFILFIMVCANLGILALYTMQLEDIGHPFPNSCQIDPTHFLRSRNANVVAIVTFYVPYGILLILAFSSLLCSACSRPRFLHHMSTNGDGLNTSRKRAAIFIFITASAGFLLMLPFYMLQVPELAYVIMSNLEKTSFYAVLFVAILIKIVFYVIFPAMCLSLKEISDIYRKAVKHDSHQQDADKANNIPLSIDK
ncbi:hypothetical protein ACF0H5_017782 [Mactra antiquata]